MRNRIALAIVLPTMLAVFVFLATVAFYDWRTLLVTRAESLHLSTDAVAEDVAFAVTLNDRELAQQTLTDVMQNNPDMLYVKVTGPDNKVIAEYGSRQLHARPDSVVAEYLLDRLAGTGMVIRPILSGDSEIGAVSINFSRPSFAARAKFYYVLALVIGLLSCTAAAVFAQRNCRLIIEPVIRLSEVVKTVRDNNNFTVRADRCGPDEVLELIGSFNDMLETLQSSDQSFQAARDEFEARITRRAYDIVQRPADLLGAINVVRLDLNNITADVRVALASEDFSGLVSATHEIRRIAVNFGAKTLYEVASQLEEVAYDAERDRIEGTCQMVQWEVDALNYRLGILADFRLAA